MNNIEFVIAITGLLIALFGVIIAAIAGYQTIRTRPIALLAVIAMILAGASMVMFAIAAQFGLLRGNDLPITFENQFPSDRAHREERIELGPFEYDTYTRSLPADEAIVGDAVDVEDRGLRCVVFWAKGPRTVTFSMLNGAWDRYSSVNSQSQLQQLIQTRHNYLQNQHDYCRNVDVPIIELGN